MTATGAADDLNTVKARDNIAMGIALTTDPERSRGQLAELCRALGEAIDVPVTAHGMWHYHHLLDALSSGELDVVWLPPILALRATAKSHCMPIAIPVRHGVSTYSSALFTRPDSPIRSLDQLDQVSAAWVDRQSAAGYLIVRALLKSRGIDLETAFSREAFLGTHNAVAAAVLEGEVDVGASFVYLDPDASTGSPKTAGWGDAPVHIICYAGSIPSDVVAVSSKLAPRQREAIQRALLSDALPDLVHAARRLIGADSFVAPNEEHLEALTPILQNLELPTGAAHTAFPPPPRSNRN